MLMLLAQASSGNTVTIGVGWLIAAGFCSGLGLALWKIFPRLLRLSLEDVIRQNLGPQLDAVHQRIDAHMNTEESSFTQIEKYIGELQRQSEERGAQQADVLVRLTAIEDALRLNSN